MRRLELLILFLSGLLFTIRFLFLITVMAEERTYGGVYEPKRVADIRIEDGSINASFIPPEREEFLKKRKVGPFIFLINTFNRDPHPVVKIKIGKSEFPFLYLPYLGSILFGYIPRIYMEVFGKNLYSLRSMFLITFLIFLSLYMRFSRSYTAYVYALSLYLITFPVFGMCFAVPFFWNQPAIFILEILLIKRISKILSSSSITSRDAFLIPFISGLILHFHLLAGGAILFSTGVAFFMSKKGKVAFEANPLAFFCGILLFFLLVLPFLILPVSRAGSILFRGKHSIVEALLTPKNSFLYYLLGIFAPSSFIEFVIHNNFGIRYLPFSIPSGLLLFTSFIGLIMERKKGAFEKFLFISGLLFLLIASFGDIRPYHINYILPFVVLFIPSFLRRLNLSDKWIVGIIFTGICYNIIQLEMIRNSVKNSSLSLSLHKEVADYLLKNNIKKIHNIAGMYDYHYLAKEIEVLDFIPFIGYNHPKDRIYLSLLFSKNEVILLESFKSAGITTGITIEEVMDIAEKTGLKVEVIKKFPSDKTPQLVLARVR